MHENDINKLQQHAHIVQVAETKRNQTTQKLFKKYQISTFPSQHLSET